jgi:hypothetical protein
MQRNGDVAGDRSAPDAPPRDVREDWEAGDRTALPFAEQLLLWAIRMTVVGMKSGSPTHHPVAVAFRKVGAEPAAEKVSMLVRIVALGALRPVQIATPCALLLTPDERCLLSVAALAQARPAVDGALVMRRLLSPAACRAVAGLARELSALLDGVGLRFAAPVSAPAPERATLAAVG